MSRGIVLKMSLSEFLLEANRLAGVVSRNAERMSAASGGRIGAHTAKEMQRLVEEILRLGRERERKVVGPIRPLVRRAEGLVAEIGAAAKVVALDKPIVAEQLRRVRSGGRQRSAFAAAWALEMHLGLVRAHQREFEAALGDNFLNNAANALRAIECHRDLQRGQLDVSAQRTRIRDGIVTRLQGIVSDVRVLLASVPSSGAVAHQS